MKTKRIGPENLQDKKTIRRTTMKHASLARKTRPFNKKPMPVAIKHNTAVSSIVHPKLTIGAPNDKYEQEADRVADQVMRMPLSVEV